MFQDQNIFRNNKINYFQYLQPNTKKNIAIASLVALSRFLVNKKTVATKNISIKDLSNISLRVIPDYIEEKVEEIKLDIQTNLNTHNIASEINLKAEEEYILLLRWDFRDFQTTKIYCETHMEQRNSINLMNQYSSEFAYGDTHINEILEFIGTRYNLEFRMYFIANDPNNLRNSKLVKPQYLYYNLCCVRIFKRYKLGYL